MASYNASRIVPEALLELTVFEVMEKENLSSAVAYDELLQASLVYGPPCLTASQLDGGCSKYISFGCPVVDASLGNRLLSGIVEIVGPPGTGKTQLCLQLAASTCHNDAYVVYVDTELSFSAFRLYAICQQFAQNDIQKRMQSVLLFFELGFADLMKRISALDRLFKQQKPRKCRLLIIDSLASIAKKHFGAHDLIARANFLTELGVKLKRLADTYCLTVVVVNQIMSSYTQSADDSGNTIASLGLLWAHIVNIRIAVQDDEQNIDLKKFTVLKSPCCPVQCFLYRVLENGVQFQGTQTARVVIINSK